MSDEHDHEGVLAAAFGRARPELAASLPELAPLSEALKALRDLLGRLPEHCAEVADGTVEAERIGLAGDILRAAAVGPLSAVRAPVPPPRYAEPPRREERHSGIPLLGGLFDREDRDARERERARHREHWRPPAEPTVHTPSLLEWLRAAFEAADRLLAAAKPPPPERVPVPWAEDSELMDVLHELLAAHAEQDPELALRHLARLKSDLALRHDIEAVEYDEDNESYFTYVRNADPADRRVLTVRPALMASGRVVRRGEIRGPARTTPIMRQYDAGEYDTSDQEGPHDD